MDDVRHLGNRAGLAIASLLLGTGLVLGFKAPDDSATLAVTDGGSGSNGTTDLGGSTGTSGTSGSNGSTGTSNSSGSSGSTGATATKAPTTNGTATVTGTLINMRYGPVQVEITVTNGKVTAVSAVELPSGGRSGMISSYAAPILTQEALAAQSASIDLVSGATYTSLAYEKSLQAALDQAGI
jgi:uncharacterized protein with FMN-binding domain